MSIAKTVLYTTLKRAAGLALACGLPFAVALQAQTYSSSTVSYTPQYNPQPQYNNPYPYNHKPRYTGEGWGKHLVLEGGGGVTPAADGTQDYANVGWNALLGGGYRFNDRLSLLAEWNFNRMGVPHSLAYSAAQVPDGNEHIWTIDLNPKFDVIHRDRTDAYVIGGGGFSRALTSFTFPVYVPCGYYFYGGCVGDVTVAKTSTNQGNIDIGIGGEWRVSPYDRGKIFLEARYLRLFSPTSNLPPGGGAGLVPVTFGYRW
ncbi:MAG TPA: hypothetical protein VMF56_08810 [Acidobacteriaceae bacterium]|nr:hypothetical protein [Acidobacteriaceae bacterium]